MRETNFKLFVGNHNQKTVQISYNRFSSLILVCIPVRFLGYLHLYVFVFFYLNIPQGSRIKLEYIES